MCRAEVLSTGKRLLDVDDDPLVLQTHREILSRAGFEVACATSGKEALKLLTENNATFDMVLCDLRLPDMSGLEILAIATSWFVKLPVLMISGWGTVASETAAHRLGAAAFLEKPLLADDLLAVVNKTLALHDTAPTPSGRIWSMETIGYASRRWVTLVMAVVRSNEDISNVEMWSRTAGRSRSTIEWSCQAAGVHAKDTLHFARGLRVCARHQAQRCDWYNHLKFEDPRTTAKFITRAGLPPVGIVPGPSDYLLAQQFVRSPSLLAAVRDILIHS